MLFEGEMVFDDFADLAILKALQNSNSGNESVSKAATEWFCTFRFCIVFAI